MSSPQPTSAAGVLGAGAGFPPQRQGPGERAGAGHRGSRPGPRRPFPRGRAGPACWASPGLLPPQMALPAAALPRAVEGACVPEPARRADQAAPRTCACVVSPPAGGWGGRVGSPWVWRWLWVRVPCWGGAQASAGRVCPPYSPPARRGGCGCGGGGASPPHTRLCLLGAGGAAHNPPALGEPAAWGCASRMSPVGPLRAHPSHRCRVGPRLALAFTCKMPVAGKPGGPGAGDTSCFLLSFLRT